MLSYQKFWLFFFSFVFAATLHAKPNQYALAVPDHFAADVAEQVFADGGNAVDAAIAVGFSLAVTLPEAGNLGGGGFMLVYFEGKPYFIDYRETAPGAAHPDMYLNENGNVIGVSSLVGHKAAGVPGTVMGLWEAHQRFGTLPWQRLLAPAIGLAKQGFKAPPQLVKHIQESLDFFAPTNFADYFGHVRADEIFIQSELAETLQRISAQGINDFYYGETAKLLVDSMTSNDGLITLEDLSSYRVVWRTPIEATWRDKVLLTAPLPSSGGIALTTLLSMRDLLAEHFKGLPHNSVQYIHLLAEMEKRVYADRGEYLGDADFIDVPVNELLDPAYIAKRAAAVNPNAISHTEKVRPGLYESPQTTHFSIVDAKGNAVSNTYTLNLSFGSGAVVEGAGFLLNDEMDDFSIKPGVPNAYGVIGGRANEIQPGKRMLSSMTPTIVLAANGQVDMVTGSPGGSTIITTVMQSILNNYDFGMSAENVASVERVHHQLYPENLITYHPTLAKDVINGLTDMGYRVEQHPWTMGDLQLLLKKSDGEWSAGSDARGRGAAVVGEILTRQP